jgi:hypothetical protein
VSWRCLIIQFHLEEKLSVQIVWLDIDLSPELDNVSEHDKFLGVPDEKCLCVEGVGLLSYVGLDQPVERNLLGAVVLR